MGWDRIVLRPRRPSFTYATALMAVAGPGLGALPMALFPAFPGRPNGRLLRLVDLGPLSSMLLHPSTWAWVPIGGPLRSCLMGARFSRTQPMDGMRAAAGSPQPLQPLQVLAGLVDTFLPEPLLPNVEPQPLGELERGEAGPRGK